MKTNTNSHTSISNLGPVTANREARLDHVAGALEEQSLQVQSLSSEELAEHRAYGADVCADIAAVQGYAGENPQAAGAQGYDPVGAIDQMLVQLQQQQNTYMAMMMMQYIIAMLQMMMEMQQGGPGQNGQRPGGADGLDEVDGSGGADSAEGAEGAHEAEQGREKDDAMTPVRAARILARYFDLLDTAAGKGKKDNVVEMADLKAVAKNPDVPEELRRAADYVVKNPMVANALDVGNKTDEVDGRFGLKDFTRFVEEHEGKEGYDAPVEGEKTPVKPTEKGEETQPGTEEPSEVPDEPTEETPDQPPTTPVDETPDAPAPTPDKQTEALDAQRDAIALYEGMRGFGHTDEQLLIKTLSNRSNRQIALLKDAYQKTYSRDLLEHVEAETSGKFRDVLVALLGGQRDESDKIDQNLVQDDARALKEAGGPAGFFTDDDKIIAIFTTRSKAHLKEVAKVFEHIHGQSLKSFIETQTSGDYEDSLLAQLT